MRRSRLTSLSRALVVALLLLPAALAVGQPPPPAVTASHLVARWVRALGGAERLRAVESISISGLIKDQGLAGTFENRETKLGQKRVVIDLDGYLLRSWVSNGQHSWFLDETGQVTQFPGAGGLGPGLADDLDLFASLSSGAASNGARYLGEDETRRFYKLRLALRGIAYTYYLDRTTYLPARREWAGGGAESFADWREVEGRKFPFRRQWGGASEAEFQVAAISLNARVDAALFHRPEPPVDYRLAAGDAARAIPFELFRNLIFVSARVNDSRPLRLLLDSGANDNVLDLGLARELNLSRRGLFDVNEQAGAAMRLKGVSFMLPGVELRDQSLSALALDELGKGLGLPVDGILGARFFTRFVVEFDFAERVIHLFEPRSYRYRGSGAILPLVLTAGRPHTRAKITLTGGRTVEGLFLVDLGFEGMLTHFGPAPPGLTTERDYAVFGGSVKVRQARAAHAELGPWRIDRPLVNFREKGGKEFDGLIGSKLLSRSRLILDYSRARMILEKIPGWINSPDAGLMVVATGRQSYRVTYVQRESWAAQQGLRAGDEFTAIDSRPIATFTVEQLEEIFTDLASHTYHVNQGR